MADPQATTRRGLLNVVETTQGPTLADGAAITDPVKAAWPATSSLSGSAAAIDSRTVTGALR
jgi:hypothetical protein